MSMERGTGGNRFIRGDASIAEMVVAVDRGLLDLARYAQRNGQRLDLGAVTVTTMRSLSGEISVEVAADLAATNPTTEGASE